MTLYLGAHTSNNGGIHMAVRRAARGGMSALQVFTAEPKYYNEKHSIRPERVARFAEALAAAGISPGKVIVHAGYVINVASQEDEKWGRSSGALIRELERSNLVGAGGVCFHPGSAGSGEVAKSLENVARAMTLALEKVSGSTRLLIENTAGAGRTVGRTAADVGAMLAQIPSALRSRAGYGLDTCHLFASGFDITRSQDRLTAVLDDFERETGEAPSFFHLNDSEGELGSNRDRHALIGEGRMGSDVFRWLLRDHRAQNVPLILETPQANPAIAEDDDTPDPYDLRMMELLGSLGGEQSR